MSATPNFVDDAADFLISTTDGSPSERSQRIADFYEFAEALAYKAGAAGFVDLAERGTPIAMARAVEMSRSCYLEAHAEKADDTGVIAAAHLMAFNLVRGLEQAPEAKKVAEMAAYLFSQETAYRRLSGKQTSSNAQN
ncbi:hypothetical protein [Sphingomonas oryzagri]|uniref:Uncharacterized protein n=1 Tax=Sphingomonas oryzagri TaxID=3042314 RepID=A0ABT6N512_9SPHN|nr:hypothetical protein [Sphingomonas oryzagri]MDH7640184.1 hypothetical protein [Sphingomonas oryzagri]